MSIDLENWDLDYGVMPSEVEMDLSLGYTLPQLQDKYAKYQGFFLCSSPYPYSVYVMRLGVAVRLLSLVSRYAVLVLSQDLNLLRSNIACGFIETHDRIKAYLKVPQSVPRRLFYRSTLIAANGDVKTIIDNPESFVFSPDFHNALYGAIFGCRTENLEEILTTAEKAVGTVLAEGGRPLERSRLYLCPTIMKSIRQALEEPTWSQASQTSPDYHRLKELTRKQSYARRTGLLE